MDSINVALDWLNGYLWGWPMVVLLLGTHLFFTIRLRFIQRYTGLAIKLSFKKDTARSSAGSTTASGRRSTCSASGPSSRTEWPGWPR